MSASIMLVDDRRPDEPLEVDVEQYTELLLPLWEGDEPRFGLF
jgi:hypothetical protein